MKTAPSRLRACSHPFVAIALMLALFSCEKKGSQQAECERGIGEACNQLGKAAEGKEAIALFRKACDLGNTNGCVNLAAEIKDSDRSGALRALKFACDRGNTHACAKFAELGFSRLP